MRIGWIVYSFGSGITSIYSSLSESTTASVRLRVWLVAKFFSAAGFETIQINLDNDIAKIQSKTQQKIDFIIISKISPAPEEMTSISNRCLDILTHFKSNGTKIIVDFCDYTLSNKDHRAPFYKKMIEMSDSIVGSNEKLLSQIKDHDMGKKCVFIPDPVEGTKNKPNVRISNTCNLLWFGHGKNIITIFEAIKSFTQGDHDFAINLKIVSKLPKKERLYIKSMRNTLKSDRFTMEFVEWSSQETVFHALSLCDAVIIPQIRNAPNKLASANRLAETLWAGRFPIAYPIPSYGEFKEAAWLGEDMLSGVRWYKEHPQEALAKIAHGQEQVSAMLSPEAVGRQWIDLVTQ